MSVIAIIKGTVIDVLGLNLIISLVSMACCEYNKAGVRLDTCFMVEWTLKTNYLSASVTTDCRASRCTYKGAIIHAKVLFGGCTRVSSLPNWSPNLTIIRLKIMYSH